ncbi:carbonic anhydrase [Verticiella sediminum]|uniref:Carbonic anhydrase n=2 Tax=Verticiella sediminum TaxID=1247510 RepID=A0A556AQE6_9BURK|nr:carbonic anhydrase [Verticiella sediminum]
MRNLVEAGQSPASLVISCSDSRVDPALLTGAAPGELFVVRNVANLVPPYAQGTGLHGTGAAIEYAVRDLKVDHIIVLGHAHCGGIKAMMNAAGGEWPERDFIGDWVAMALGAAEQYVQDESAEGGRSRVPLERLKSSPFLVERAAIRRSLDNLMTYPWLRERVEAGTLQVHGWWFDLDTGDLWKTEGGERTLLPVI